MKARFTWSLAVLALAPTARAEDLTPERIAFIQHEQAKADEEIAKQHGDKGPADMDNDERRQYIEERAAAEQKVLEGQGVSAKELAIRSLRMNPDERAEYQQAQQQILEKERAEQEAKQKAADEKAAAEAPREAKDVPVQRGVTDAQPVMVVGEEDTPEEVAAHEDAKLKGPGEPAAPAAKAKPGKAAKPAAKAKAKPAKKSKKDE